MTPFDLKLAWRQSRGQSRRVWLLLMCLAMGVAARVSVGSFLGQVDKSLSKEARNLLMADLEISSRQPLSDQKKQDLRRHLPEESRLQEVLHFVTMAIAPHSGKTRMVELRAVENSYPFYGRFQLSDQEEKETENSGVHKLNGNAPLVYVQPELLTQLGILKDQFNSKVVRLGKIDFQIAGTIDQEPGLGASVFSLGPRVIVGRNQIRKTGLADFGSRLHYSILIALPDASMAEPLSEELKALWKIPQGRRYYFDSMGPQSDVQVRTFKDKQIQVGRFFERLGDYLRLVSLLALLLGGIGAGSVVRSFLVDQMESVAILRSVGSSSNRIIRIYLIQIVILSFAGSLLGAGIGISIQNLLIVLFTGFLPLSVSPGMDWSAVAWGIGLGILTSCYFSLLPLLEVQNVKPLSIFRKEQVNALKRKTIVFTIAIGIIVLELFAIIESHSIILGSAFTGAIVLGGVILYSLAYWLLPGIAFQHGKTLNFGLKHGISNLARPGLRPYSAVVAIGLSTLLLGFLSIYQYSLLRDLDFDRNKERLPNFFLIDIQEDQLEELNHFFLREKIKNFVLSPMVKARYRKINSQIVQDEEALTREEDKAQSMRNREQNLSYRAQLGADETLVSGKWMDIESNRAEASLEEWFAERLGAKLGDALTFDVQGVEITAEVTSIRKIRWSGFQPNFFILLTPKILESAPKTWVGSISGIDSRREDFFQQELVKFFPNVTLFNVKQVTQRVTHILERIYWSIRYLALFALATGLIVIIGIALSTAREREQDTLLLRVLGARRKTILVSFLTEFFILASVPVIAGSVIALFFGWVVIDRYLEIPFAVPWKNLISISVLTLSLCVLTGWLSCRRVLHSKPLELLREK